PPPDVTKACSIGLWQRWPGKIQFPLHPLSEMASLFPRREIASMSTGNFQAISRSSRGLPGMHQPDESPSAKEAKRQKRVPCRQIKRQFKSAKKPPVPKVVQ